MKVTGAGAIIKSLEAENADVMFGYPGAAICPFYDALIDSGIKHVLTRQEQGAVHAASGYARVSGKTGVCVATSGPGATNLITGIATAFMDSIPIVAITGQVLTGLIGRDAFQEADITGATIPFCKHNYLVKKADDLPRVFKEAFHIASTGRPGPVLIDIPIDVQNKTFEFKYPDDVEIRGYKPTYKGHVMQIKKAAEAVFKAKKPVICAGGGIINANANGELLRFAEMCRIPVATTLMGIGSIPFMHELNLGMVGSHGSHAANHAINNADLLLIIGARAGDRAIGTAGKIAEKALVIHIDIDPAEIGKNIGTTIPIVGDVKYVLEELTGIISNNHIAGKTGEEQVNSHTGMWLESLVKVRNERLKNSCIPRPDSVNPGYLLGMLADIAGDNTIVTTEVGQNQIWAANNYNVKKPRTFISSGGMGTMGYGLPSAIGAKIASPESKVVVISGDGSFQMSMQELGTIKQEKLGIKIILFNNSRLGMVRELQKTRYCGRYSQVMMEDNPDFVRLVNAYGFNGEKITSDRDVKSALKKTFSDDSPYLLECLVDPEEPTL